MLWRKAWLECRLRTVLCLLVSLQGLLSLFLLLPDKFAQRTPPLSAAEISDRLIYSFILLFGAIVIPVCAKILAGAGVNTQTAWGMMKGFHGSMYFLLSLPVSRAHLLTVRASVGAALLAAVALAVWLLFLLAAPLFGQNIDAAKLFSGLPRVLLIGAVFYCQAVWLCSFLDEFWSGTAGLTILGFVLGYSAAGTKAFGDILHLLSPAGDQVPVWHYFLYLAICAAYLAAARWVVERKEY
jgi:hypothetical protein